MRKEILDALAAVSDSADRLLVIYSSLPHLGIVPKSVKWEFLSALKQLASAGKTIALPAFTPSFCQGTPFHIRHSPSETGILGQWLLELEEARRTPHPIYSWAVIGPLSQELVDCKNSTTWSDDSAFAYFEDLDASIIMLGIDWPECTHFHRFEEMAQVPQRFFKTFQGVADFGSGPEDCESAMYVRDLGLDPQKDFSRALDLLRQEGGIRETTCGSGLVQAAKISRLKKVSLDLLEQDPFGLVQGGRRLAHQLSARARAEAAPPLKVAVLGSANLEFIKNEIQQSLTELVPDRTVEVYAPEFDQSRQELLLEESVLKTFNPDFALFVDRAESLLRVHHLEEAAHQAGMEQVLTLLDSQLDMLKRFAESSGCRCFVASFARQTPPVRANADLLSTDGSAAVVEQMNDRLRERFAQSDSLQVLDIGRLADPFPSQIFDPRLWYLGRFPFSQEFTRRVASAFTGLVLAATGRTSRLLAIDLDNTLWGGVIGEDGISGIQLGGDYPGNAYAGFQRSLRLLSQRGIALAIVSKNDEDLALAAIEEHPEMVLRGHDIVAHRIDWQPKWRNIEGIAEDLNLNLANVMFIDDSPIEREHVRQQLPMVRVLELPDDPALFSEALLSDPFMETMGVTEEDRKRVRGYQTRKEVEKERTRFERMEDFYGSLRPSVSVAQLDQYAMARAVQLISKTTQFNTTTPRYSQAELDSMLADGNVSVCILGYEDKFSEKENIGLVIVRWHSPSLGSADIDTFLMSCRVLGRGVEAGVLSWVGEEARRRGIERIVGKIIPTSRNTPVRSLYEEYGFSPSGADGWWHADLNETPLAKPSWLTLTSPVAATP